MTKRILLVSNRLPVTVRSDEQGLRVKPSNGGLATGLAGPHEHGNSVWLGWPGELPDLDTDQRSQLEKQLTDLRCVPIYLKAEQVEQFYQGFSNGVLWPLLHYLLDKVQLDAWKDWEAYQQVNEQFAAAVIAQYQPGDLIWVHDYHLMLLPRLLREKLPDAKIGFFLHTPFPSSEVYRILPWRQELLAGLLGADLIGFHTYSYLRNFATSLMRVMNVETSVDRARFENREIRFGVFQMGIDAQNFADLAREPDVGQEMREILGHKDGCRTILGIDRLDYTKGLPRRLLAFEQLLKNTPGLRGNVRFIQLVVPSRTDVDAYAKLRRQLEEIIGRINGAYGTVNWTPVQYLYRSLSKRALVALYRAADVMLVTPLRDGMNLVAKEFAASRIDNDGVLVLSEFAGAATELVGALLVNPYDLNHVATVLKQALTIPERERAARMRQMRERIMHSSNDRWFRSFIRALDHAARDSERRGHFADPQAMDGLVKRMRKAPELLFFFDYDGLLLPFNGHAQPNAPDQELLRTIDTLSRRQGAQVHLVSSCTREALESWFKDMPIGLHAEYGFWSRLHPKGPWLARRKITPEWKDKIRPILEDFAERTPGSFVEDKSVSLVWDYRLADPEFGALQAKELRLFLSELLSNVAVSVLHDHHRVEILQQGVHKGSVISLICAQVKSATTIVALGDDTLDETLFRSLPPEGLAVCVGPGPSGAAYRLQDAAAVRSFMGALV